MGVVVPKVWTLDYEAYKIEKRPVFPPKAVGLAVREPSGKKYYMSWGHREGKNNISKADAIRKIKWIYAQPEPKLYHNSSFDCAVSNDLCAIPYPHWKDYHDTLFLAFLHDPRDESLSLKPMADKYLDMAPEEQTELHDWIETNLAKEFGSDQGKFTKENPAAAYIAYAPAELVGKYAIGDVERTYRLFKFFWEKVFYSMGICKEPYIRELKCMPIFNDMSEQGIKGDYKALKRDVPKWEEEIERLQKKICKRLKTPDLNIGSSKQLADALDRCKKVDDWDLTPKGNKKTARESLLKHCNDTVLVHDLSRLGMLSTYTSTFGKPWLETLTKYGRLYPEFHQVRKPTGETNINGTRTGRPSSTSPNFLNVPKNPQDPDLPWTKDLPQLRKYLLPDDGTVFLDRDYSQQELRILAHFEDGDFMRMYLDNPFIDAHDAVATMVKSATGKLYPRKQIKGVNFGILYGMGLAKLAKTLKLPLEETKILKGAVKNAVAGLATIDKDIKQLDSMELPIITWGGRYYWTEPAKMRDGRKRDYVYKQLNTLIQGSAADATKEAMIRVNEACDKSRLALQVYDQITICTEKGYEKDQMEKMRDAMESLVFDVPMLSEGEIGRKNWQDLKPYEPKRVDVPW